MVDHVSANKIKINILWELIGEISKQDYLCFILVNKIKFINMFLANLDS